MKKIMLFLVILILPSIIFAKGDIVTYHPTYRSAPTNDQLDKLTHLVLFSITPASNFGVPMPSGGWANNINDVVSRAHARNVKVIIALGGWGKTGSFSDAVKPANRTTFVNNIMAMVNQYGFDGVDIDWEYPNTAEEVTNFEGFMVALKQALGNKRLSFAIGAQYQPSKYTNATYAALDALHLMTYDGSTSNGAHHADMAWSKGVVDRWVNSSSIANSKIYFGVPFYGRNSGGEETYAAIIAPNQAQASQLDSYNGWRYDGIPQIKEKTKYAYDREIGGIMIWETGQDVAANNQYSLLKAIKDETDRLGGTTGPVVTPQNRTIIVTHNGNGTVKDENTTVNSGGSVEVANGENKTLTLTANSGFSVTDIKVGGVSQNAAATLTLSNVTGNQTVDVTFAKRINVPSTFNACEYSKRSAEIVPTTDEYGKYVGYLVNNSTLEYLINVTQEAATYKISARMATENSGRSISIYNGSSTTPLATLNAANTSNWWAWTTAQANIALPAGNVTLRIVANGAINIENIAISRENETPLPSDPDAPDLADGTWEWEIDMDDNNLGSSATFGVAPQNVSFNLKQGVAVPADDRWTWAEIASYPGGDWTRVTGITITYTSNQPIVLTLRDTIGLGEEGRPYHYTLVAGTDRTVTIPVTEFGSLSASDWSTLNKLQTSQLDIFDGVSISPENENVATTGSIKVLKINGLVLTDDTPIVYRKTVSAKAIAGASASIVNGNINLSLPAGANSANIVLFDVRGRILFERSVALHSNAASVALPKLLRNQAAILQVKTNSGFNLTKKILIK